MGTSLQRQRIGDRSLEGDVAGGKDVGMAGAGKQVDLRRPRADARQGDESSRCRLGVEQAQALQVEAVSDGARQGKQRALLGPRQASRAHGGLSGIQQPLRGQRIDDGDQPAEDRVGAGARHLLRGDDRGKAGETRRRQAQRHITRDGANRGQSRVQRHQRIQPIANLIERFNAQQRATPFRRGVEAIARRASADQWRQSTLMTRATFRFAPSPNGELHLGHAYSALLNQRMAHERGGLLLLRIEDIDRTRSSAAFEEGIYRDLKWLGIEWERPVRRQSQHMADYAAALETLKRAGLVYPAFMGRGEVRALVAEAEAKGRTWPRDPDGAPHYPDRDRHLSHTERSRRLDAGAPHAWRLDTRAALAAAGARLSFTETGEGPDGETGTVALDPVAWSDPVLARMDVPTSYHLSVTVDDALQGVTHVVRGRDLFHATAIHRLLQALLGLPVPLYHHHGLIFGPDGRKLSKSRGDSGISALRQAGVAPCAVRAMVGLGQDRRTGSCPRQVL